MSEKPLSISEALRLAKKDRRQPKKKKQRHDERGRWVKSTKGK